MESARTPSTPSGALPIPPRYRWLRRTGIFLLIFLPVLVAVRLWWGYEANARLERTIRETRIAGMPSDPAEFSQSPVPSELNAALVFQSAARSLILTRAQADLVMVPRGRRIDDASRHTLLESTRVSRELLRKARSLPECDFWLGSKSLAATTAPDFLPYSRLGPAVILSAEYLHDLGRDTEAVETLADASLFMKRLCESDLLLGVLIAFDLSDRVAQTVERIGPDVVSSGRVSADVLQALNDDLLNADYLRVSLGRTIAFEGLYCLRTTFQGYSTFMAGSFRSLSNDLWAMEALYWLVRPTLQLDCAQALKEWTPRVKAALQAHLPEARRILASAPPLPAGPSLARPLSPWVMPELRYTIEGSFPKRVHRALAATALAIWRYERDQHHRPAQLEDLVPQYLSQIPEDPLSPPGTRVRYWPDLDQPQLSCGDSTSGSPVTTLSLTTSQPAVTTRTGSGTP